MSDFRPLHASAPELRVIMHIDMVRSLNHRSINSVNSLRRIISAESPTEKTLFLYDVSQTVSVTM